MSKNFGPQSIHKQPLSYFLCELLPVPVGQYSERETSSRLKRATNIIYRTAVHEFQSYNSLAQYKLHSEIHEYVLNTLKLKPVYDQSGNHSKF